MKVLTERELQVLELIISNDLLSAYQIWKTLNQTIKISYKNVYERIKKLENDDLIIRDTTISKKSIYFRITTKSIFFLLSIGRYIQKILLHYCNDPVVNDLVYNFFDKRDTIDYSTSFLNKQISHYLQKCVFLSIRTARMIRNLKERVQYYYDNHKNDPQVISDRRLNTNIIDLHLNKLKEQLEIEIERENRNLFFNIALEVTEDTTPFSYHLPASFELVYDPIPFELHRILLGSVNYNEIERVSVIILKINGDKIPNQKKIKFSGLKQGVTIDLQICYNDGGIENLRGIIKDVSKSVERRLKIFNLSIDFENHRKGVFEISKQIDTVKIRQTLANDPSLPRLRNDMKAFDRMIQLRKELDRALNKINSGK